MRARMLWISAGVSIAFAGALGTASSVLHASDPSTVASSPVLDRIRQDARNLEPLAQTDLGRNFLRATAHLPASTQRVIYHDAAKTFFCTASQYSRLSPQEQATLTAFPVTGEYYYESKYGSPLAYLRALDIAALSTLGSDVDGKRILDFGYGSIGQLRLLASLGAEVVGVDVDPMLPALYGEPGDQGDIRGANGKVGTLTLVHGKFPSDPGVFQIVGGGYDLVLAKNVLKNGYMYPVRPPADSRQLVHLDIEDYEFLRVVFSRLKPCGLMLIYNICPAPAPADQPYNPAADGHCPFPIEMILAVGFEVPYFDVNDNEPIRRIAEVLGWDKGESPINLKRDLFGYYTLLQKPAERPMP